MLKNKYQTSDNDNTFTPVRIKYFALAATSLGVLLINIDLFIMNVAIPTISKSLNIHFNTALWTIAAYAVMIGIFPVSMGKLSDMWGEKRSCIAGIVVFTLSSLACGLSPNIIWIIFFG